MSKKMKNVIKVALFTLSSLVFWVLLYTRFNTNHVLTHSVLSGILLVLPVLILNYIGSGIFMQTMRQQNRAMAEREQRN